MQKMSGLDLRFAVAELAHLQGKRIAKIRRTDDGVFLFKIGSEEIAFEPGVRLHLYEKHTPRAGRKMGHLSAVGATADGPTGQPDTSGAWAARHGCCSPGALPRIGRRIRRAFGLSSQPTMNLDIAQLPDACDVLVVPSALP